MIKPKGNALLLYIRAVKIGNDVFYGAGSHISGVVIADGVYLPVLTDLYVNQDVHSPAMFPNDALAAPANIVPLGDDVLHSPSQRPHGRQQALLKRLIRTLAATAYRRACKITATDAYTAFTARVPVVGCSSLPSLD